MRATTLNAQTIPAREPRARATETAHGHDGHDGHGGPSALRLGIMTGVVGATAVALWFLAVDVIAGHPLFTPAYLGGVLAGDTDVRVAEGANRVWWAVLYTPVHYLMFAIAGIVAATILRKSAQIPALRALLVMLLLAFVVAFLGLVTVLERTALGTLAWSQLAAGGAIGGLAMAAYLYSRRHAARAGAATA